MGDRLPFVSRQSLLLLNFFFADHIAQYLPNLIATWNPPLCPVHLLSVFGEPSEWDDHDKMRYPESEPFILIHFKLLVISLTSNS